LAALLGWWVEILAQATKSLCRLLLLHLLKGMLQLHLPPRLRVPSPLVLHLRERCHRLRLFRRYP
jgi:hypothetical protein